MEETGWQKLLSTRLIFGIILSGLGFTAYVLNAKEFLVFGGFLAGIYASYITGNTYSKSVALKNNK